MTARRAFSVAVFCRHQGEISCDEWSEARWVRDAAGLDCPENVRQLVRLALAAP